MDANSRKDNLINAGFKKFIQFGYAITQPSRKITEVGEQRNARLLSLFLITLFGMFMLLNISYFIFIPGYGLPLADLFGYAFMSIL